MAFASDGLPPPALRERVCVLFCFALMEETTGQPREDQITFIHIVDVVAGEDVDL